jgi:hypothetical protein
MLQFSVCVGRESGEQSVFLQRFETGGRQGASSSQSESSSDSRLRLCVASGRRGIEIHGRGPFGLQVTGRSPSGDSGRLHRAVARFLVRAAALAFGVYLTDGVLALDFRGPVARSLGALEITGAHSVEMYSESDPGDDAQEPTGAEVNQQLTRETRRYSLDVGFTKSSSRPGSTYTPPRSKDVKAVTGAIGIVSSSSCVHRAEGALSESTAVENTDSEIIQRLGRKT